MPRTRSDNGFGAEQRSVRQSIAAILREAELHADLTAAFLRANGIRPFRGQAGASVTGDLPPQVTDFLLSIGAALRLRMWERSGVKSQIAAELPTAAELVVSACRRASGDSADGPGGWKISQAVLAAAMRGLLRRSLDDIGVDVVLPEIDPTLLLDQISELLWRNRNVITKPEVEHGS